MAQKRTSASEMLSGLKSRLGFAHTDEEDEDEEFIRYDGDMDDYDDFDDDYSGTYDDYDDFDDTSSSYRSSSKRSSRFGRPDSSPNLVSLEDVREHSKTVINSSRGSYESAHRDRGGASYAAGSGAYIPATGSGSNRYTSTYQRSTIGRDLVESNGPAVSSPAYNAAQRSESRSEGLNSLFQPSTDTSVSSASAPSASSFSTRSVGAAALSGKRELDIIQPRVYNDVEGVTRALKNGHVVVLAMAATPEDLFKRLLDFSFGVASALDAHVDCVGGKVYVLAVGSELSENELQQLRTQGVL